ncbi:MAG: hypothetical protein JXX29_03640, partial [Deltaproteobacteria bacterium]|nr:hypothetical protein [Deltaproteobacteria bacterium]
GAALHFAGSGRRTAKVISLVRNDRNTPEHNFIFIVDCERLKFNTLLPAALYRNNLSENIQLLFEYLTQLLPKALTHKTRAPRTSKGFPLYEDFESLIQSCNQ